MSPGSRSPGLRQLVAGARGRLPASHRALLEQIGVQDAVIDDWPDGVLDLYVTLREPAPERDRLRGAIAVWLPSRKVVAYNGPALEHGLDDELSAATRQTIVDNIAWHEYGHSLSVTRASASYKRRGPRLVGLLPDGLRAAIDADGSYGPREVFDEVIANVYALMIGRAVHNNDYVLPDFLHRDVVEAFTAVIPWPPDSQ